MKEGIMTQRDQTNSALLDRPLAKGSHIDPKVGACVIEWLRLREQLDFSDDILPCQSPVIHRFLISVNDRCPDAIREELKPIAVQSLGTANDGKDQKRAYRLADVACREWAPIALEAGGYRGQAAELRALPPVRTKATAARARDRCRAYADAADAANAATYAAADAAAAAYAAADAANAYAAADAADAADAAADAADAADAANAAAYAAAYAAADADAANAAANAAAWAAAWAAAYAAGSVWRRAIEIAGELCRM